MTHGRALVMLAVSLVVLLGGTLAVSVAATPGGPAVAQPAPPPPLPLPTGDPCTPDSPLPICHLPVPSTRPSSTTPVPPCTGEGCIPRPSTSLPPSVPGAGQPGQADNGEADCGITDIDGCVTNAINGFFRGIVTSALNPLLDLLSTTLLTTPMPDSLPRIGELWDNSWQILLACYGLLVLVAGVLVMAYQTLQTRHSIREIAPRLVVGFLAGALSLWVATKGIQLANGLAQAVMGGGLDANSAGETLRNMVVSSTGQGGIFVMLIGLVLIGILLALLVSYVVRVALTVILIAGAPIALMFHALPQTEGVAWWWWKSYGGCLAIQVGQSLTLITAMKVFLGPGGFTLFGPTPTGLVNLLVALALLYILFKIPFWVLSSVKGGGGRSLVGSLVKGFLAYKTFGLLRGGGGKPRSARPPKPPDPYARTRTTSTGQYILPLPGVRRTRRPSTPRPGTPPAPNPRAPQGRQLALPLGEDWPENKPVLGRDGQYRLPLDVTRTRKPTPPASATTAASGGQRPARAPGRQLELPFDPYKGNRPTRTGQYPLPLDGIHRVPRPAAPPPPAPSVSAARRGRVVQPELPFDPYKGNRATSTGQYPLPLDGVHRVPHPKPTPLPPAASAPRPAPRAGRQLRLPVDLPKLPRLTSPRTTPMPRPIPPSAIPPRPTPGDKTS